MQQPAISRYGATSPDLLRWFKRFNAGRKYRDQVKPFGFLLAMTVSPFSNTETILDLAASNKRSKKAHPFKPAAAYDTDPAKAAASAFCRDSGEPIPPELLKTYAETLAQYHLHPESKFLNGNYVDTGTTQRRHVQILGVRHIGKESNDWETQAVLGFDPDVAPEYGMNAESIDAAVDSLRSLIAKTSTSKAANALGIKQQQLNRMLKGILSNLDQDFLAGCIAKIKCAHDKIDNKNAIIRAGNIELQQAVQNDGLRATAKRLGLDPSNLRRRIKNSAAIGICQNTKFK